MENELITLLKKVGFTQKEAQVYLALLELGQGDASEISKKAGLKRTIIYVIIDELIEKGYATKLPNKKINTYQTIDPSVILTQIKLVSKNLAEMVPYLRSLQNKSDLTPKIHFIDNKEGILKIYEEMNSYKNQFFISSYSRIEEIFPKIFKRWLEGYKNGNYNFIARHLIPDNQNEIEFGKKLFEVKQRVRTSKNLSEIKMDFTIYGDKLAITSLEEKPFMVVIQSQSLVNSILPIFEIAWKNGKEILN